MISTPQSSITICIQAGGQSSRMGQDKGLVELAGKPMVQHVLDGIAGLADEIIITTNDQPAYAQFGQKMVSDETPGAGALPGLLTALQAATGDHVLLLAVDMPFISRAVINHLLTMRHEANLIVPRWEDRFQPMQAVYERAVCESAVSTALAQDQKRMVSFYDDITLKKISSDTIRALDPHGHTFFNVNTPDELAQAEQLLA